MRRKLLGAAVTACAGLLVLAAPQAMAAPTPTLIAHQTGDQTVDQTPNAQAKRLLPRFDEIERDLEARLTEQSTAESTPRVIQPLADITLTTCQAQDLIDAIVSLNGTGGTLNLRAGCVYTLTSPFAGVNGLPPITNTITINGFGAVIERNSATAFRIFLVESTGNLTLNRLTVRNGEADGGGGIFVDASGRLTANNVTLTQNTAVAGGGLANVGTAVLNNSEVRSNTATTAGASALGGGILNASGATLTLFRTTVQGNTANGLAAGGGGIVALGTVNLNNSSITGNTATSSTTSVGGGVYAIGTFSSTNSNYTNNRSTSTDTGLGGGFANDTGGTATLTGDEFTGNTANGSTTGAGGAVLNTGQSTLRNVEFLGNAATGATALGGALANAAILGNGSTSVIRDLATGNRAAGTAVAQGGAFYNEAGGSLTINDVLITNNVATSTGNTGQGAAITNRGTLSVINSILTANRSNISPGGINNDGGTVTLNETIVFGNTPTNCAGSASPVPGCFG